MKNVKGLVVRFFSHAHSMRARFCVIALVALAATATVGATGLAPSSASIADTSTTLPTPSRARLVLTAQEIAYVRSAKPVRVGLAGSRPPLYSFNERGELEGMLGDYLRWIGESTGLAFNVVSAASAEDVLKRAAAGEIDLRPVFATERGTVSGFSITRPYFSTPIVYIARQGLTDVTPSNSFNGYRVAVTSSSAINEYLERGFPDAKRIQ